MSVPEGKMALMTTRREVWFAVNAMLYLTQGRTPPQGFLDVLECSVIPNLSSYLEATDGPPALSWVQSPSSTEAGVG